LRRMSPEVAQIYRSKSRNLPAGIGGQADGSQLIGIDQMQRLVSRAEPRQHPRVECRLDLAPKCSAPAVEPGDPRSTSAIRSRSSFISLVRPAANCRSMRCRSRIRSVRRLLHTR
jgi:hypothetical protein